MSCRECQDNRCNNWTDTYYCKSVEGINRAKECQKNDCYILKFNNNGKRLRKYFRSLIWCNLNLRSKIPKFKEVGSERKVHSFLVIQEQIKSRFLLVQNKSISN